MAQQKTRNRRRGKSAGKDIGKVERQIEALRLRRRGLNYREVATQLAVNVSTAYRDVQEALGELEGLRGDLAEENRALDLERLDIAIRCCLDRIEAGEYEATNSLVAALKRRAALLGLDQPSKQEITGKDGAALLTFAELAKKAAE